MLVSHFEQGLKCGTAVTPILAGSLVSLAKQKPLSPVPKEFSLMESQQPKPGVLRWSGSQSIALGDVGRQIEELPDGTQVHLTVIK
jgi:hypothetical protein